MHEIDHFVYGDKTCREIQTNLNVIEKKMSKYSPDEPIKKFDREDIDDIIYRSERVAISFRTELENARKDEITGVVLKDEPLNSLENLERNYKISIEFSDEILRIKCPFTFKKFDKKRKARENYMFINYINLALKKWSEENNFELERAIKSPLVVAIIRKGNRFNPTKLCDNDNMENGRIVNGIFYELNYSDNVMQMDLISCFRQVEDMENLGMEFVVTSRTNIGALIAELYPESEH